MESPNFVLLASDDYTIESADLTVTIPAGEPMEQCIPVGIVDDEVALEREETFQFFFVTLPEGVVAGDPDEAVITIVDDDDGKYKLWSVIGSPTESLHSCSNSCIFHHPCRASQ